MQIFCILCANLRKIAIIFVDIENLHYLCEKIAGNLKYQITMEENNKWKSLRKTLISKYAIAIYVFAVIMIFMGDQSLIQFVKRAKKARMIEAQIQQNQREIQQAQRAMLRLDDKDSLERFAREEYNMHADNEDVYLVD